MPSPHNARYSVFLETVKAAAEALAPAIRHDPSLDEFRLEGDRPKVDPERRVQEIIALQARGILSYKEAANLLDVELMDIEVENRFPSPPEPEEEIDRYRPLRKIEV